MGTPLMMMGCGTAVAGVPVTDILDNFTDTDGVSLSAHTIAPNNVTATSWVNDTGTVEILSNKASTDATVTNWCRATCNWSSANGTVEGSYTNTLATPDPYAGLIGRCVDATRQNFWLLGQGSGTRWMLWEHSTGETFTQRAQSGATTITEDVTYDLKMVFNGNDIECFVNGVSVITYTSTTYNTATRFGVNFYDAAPYNQTFDSFRVSA